MADAKRESLFPGTWTEKCAPMFRIDLAAARLAWLDEAKGNAAETERRTKSRFLCPVDGCGCDFHGLRHSFISNLAAGGVHPKVAQQLARYSTITLTTDCYSHLGLIDMTGGTPGHFDARRQCLPSDRNDRRLRGFWLYPLWCNQPFSVLLNRYRGRSTSE